MKHIHPVELLIRPTPRYISLILFGWIPKFYYLKIHYLNIQGFNIINYLTIARQVTWIFSKSIVTLAYGLR